ncbi:MAG: hypothetical protein ABL888_21965 [Pirellulaceae bacterium]
MSPDPFDFSARQDNADGSITTWEYDSLSRLDKMTEYGPDVTPENLTDNPLLARYDYDVRSDGKRTGVTETHWFDTIAHETRIDWEYDGAGRLVEETFNHYDNSLDFSANYEFDLVGNRLKKTTDNGSNNSIDEAISYIYDNNDRLTTENIDTGNNGSVDSSNSYGFTGTQQTTKTVSVGGSVTTAIAYSYDLQGRMNVVVTETKNGSGTVTRRERVTYNYDTYGI